jgi:hypothetical protein
VVAARFAATFFCKAVGAFFAATGLFLATEVFLATGLFFFAGGGVCAEAVERIITSAATQPKKRYILETLL